MTDGERTLFVRVTGRVQGVNYRNYTVTAAKALGIKGWVVNRDDGSVEAAIHGAGQRLADLVGIMRKGPPDARVDKLDVTSTDRGQVDEPPREGYTF